MDNSLDIKWIHLTNVLNDFADTFIELARQNLDSNNTNASHNLYDSFEKIIEIGEDYFSVKISMADYGKYVENGRGPGKFPPMDKIKEWIEIKPVAIQPGMNGRTPSIDQLTFLISRKIANEGTEAQPFFEPAREEAITRFDAAISQAISDDIYDFINEAVLKRMNEAFGGK